MNNIKLNNGVEIPQIGLGVFQSKDGEETSNAVKWALENGYRHIDTAKIYRNEASVAQGIKESGVPREEIFVTTKLWNKDIRNGNTVNAFNKSLELLDTDYIDLYLIHWPTEGRNEAYLEMEKLYEAGKIKAIGVSNFNIHHLEELAEVAHIVPAINQIESNPYFANQELIDYCLERGIQVEVWSPLGGTGNTSILNDEVIKDIAAKHNKSCAQVIIRWHMQRNTIVLPKSVHENRIIQNIDVFDFELTDEDMARINALDRNTRVGADPDNFDF